MNKCGTHHYRLQEPGIRYEKRQPPLWMRLNMWAKRCWCGGEIIKPQRKYCCWTHSQLWYFSINGWWEGVRLGVIRLHNYTCVECGFTAPERESNCRDDSLFDVDHELAICLGGMCYDIDNLRPLCKACHKIKTANDMKQLASNRKAKDTTKLEVFA